MQITVAGKQVATSDALRTHVETGLETITGKYFDRALEARVTFRKDAKGSTGGHFACDINLHAGRGLTMRGEGQGADAQRAFDVAAERRLIETEVELATSLGWSGRTHRARTDLAEVLVRARQVLPADDRTTMRVRHTHAIWTGRSGQWEEAMRLFAELLPDRRRLLGDDHVATLRTRMELAIWTGRAGDRRPAIRARRG